MIDLLGDPHEITMQIASSDIVVSSSLHGLVVADAYDVPSIWMKADERIKGDGFKFEDYEAYRGEKYLGAAMAGGAVVEETRCQRP